MSEFQTMKAVFYEEYGDISKFQIGDRPRPIPGPKDIIVQMKGAGEIRREREREREDLCLISH